MALGQPQFKRKSDAVRDLDVCHERLRVEVLNNLDSFVGELHLTDSQKEMLNFMVKKPMMQVVTKLSRVAELLDGPTGE